MVKVATRNGASRDTSTTDESRRYERHIPTVKLEEIADIKEVGKAESISRTNGKQAIAIQIVKARMRIQWML